MSEGRGEFTMTDHTPDATIQQDLIEDAIADKTNDPYGLLAQTVYDVVIDDTGNLDSLTWDEMVQLLKEEKDLVKSARDYQTEVNHYYALNPASPTYHSEYQAWVGKTLDQLHKHREKLAEKLGKKVAEDSKLNKFIAYVTPKAGLAIGGGAGLLVGTGHFDVVSGFAAGAFTAFATDLTVEILGRSAQKLIESSAVGRYRTSFGKSVKLKSDEELLR